MSVKSLLKSLLFYIGLPPPTRCCSALRLHVAVQGEQGRSIRAVTTGQKVNVWLELEAAEPYGNVNTDVFQVCISILLACSGNFVPIWSRIIQVTLTRKRLLLIIIADTRQSESRQGLFCEYGNK